MRYFIARALVLGGLYGDVGDTHLAPLPAVICLYYVFLNNSDEKI